MYLVGWENIYPAEMENFLSTHPKIKQVYVVVIPDQRLGEISMVFVELKEEESCSEEEVFNSL